ncbi:MAG TPA: hypothetical protein VFF32_13190 [Dermatophilaceae bacterium]|nr:hypothetical protein [Dermatophilaceae bacterium]
MLRTLLSGFVLALCTAVVLMIGGGSELEHVALLGAALGGVIGLVPHDPPLGKLGGFALGFGMAWMAFAIRAAVLPDSTIGRAVAAFLVILICGGVAAISSGRMPLWSSLVGAAAMVGAYETSYGASPSTFLTTSPQAASTVLLAAAFGYIGTTVIHTFVKSPEASPTRRPSRAPDSDKEMLERLMAGETK